MVLEVIPRSKIDLMVKKLLKFNNWFVRPWMPESLEVKKLTIDLVSQNKIDTYY